MKKLLLVCAFSMIFFLLSAAPITYRNSAGNVIATAATDGSITTFRNSAGKITGTATRSGNQATFRDAVGRIVGTAALNGSHLVYRDSHGKISGGATIFCSSSSIGSGEGSKAVPSSFTPFR